MDPVNTISSLGIPAAMLLGIGWFVVWKVWPSVTTYLERVHRSLDRRDAALETLVAQFTDMVSGLKDIQTNQEAVLSVVVQLEEAHERATHERQVLNDGLFDLAQAVNELRATRKAQ